MTSFWRVVNEVIRDADVILDVLDSRFPEETRNKELEDKIDKINSKGVEKKIIFILNKSDLLKVRFQDIHFSGEPHIFVSAKNNYGTTQLRSMLRGIQRDLPKANKELLVGVVGYPNTGKSSLINALRQKKVADTSPVPGFTRALKKIKIGKDIYLLDTPGVFAYKEKDEEREVLVNVRDYRKVKDPEGIALEILNKAFKNNPAIIKELYGIDPVEDSSETLTAIAKKFNWIVKGGKPNIDQTARRIIQDWQRGKLII
jgi:hypothetical protein